MRQALGLLLLMAFVTSAAAATPPPSAHRTAHHAVAMPDHGLSTPGSITWGPPPPVFKAGAEFAVLQGDPNATGPYTVRLKMPDGSRIMPHWHPATENVTVISGTFHLGTGPKFDTATGSEMPAGSFGFVGPHMVHYAWVTGETVVQVHGMGPFKLTYVDPADIPSGPTAHN